MPTTALAQMYCTAITEILETHPASVFVRHSLPPGLRHEEIKVGVVSGPSQSDGQRVTAAVVRHLEPEHGVGSLVVEGVSRVKHEEGDDHLTKAEGKVACRSGELSGGGVEYSLAERNVSAVVIVV